MKQRQRLRLLMKQKSDLKVLLSRTVRCTSTRLGLPGSRKTRRKPRVDGSVGVPRGDVSD